MASAVDRPHIRSSSSGSQFDATTTLPKYTYRTLPTPTLIRLLTGVELIARAPDATEIEGQGDSDFP